MLCLLRGSLLAVLISVQMPAVAKAELEVVSTIRPLHYIVAAIISDLDTSFVIENSSHSAHTISLTPQGRLRLQEADMVLWIGPEFEIYLADLITELNADKTIITARDLDTLTLHRMSNGQIDPHLWLDPDNAIAIAQELAARLSQLNPERSGIYSQRFAGFKSKVDEEWARILSRLNPADFVSYVVYHDAYRYFEQALELRHSSVLLDNPQVQPGMRDVLAVRDRLDSIQPRCVILEPDSSTELVDTLLQDMNPRRVTIDLLGYGISNHEDAYLELLMQVAAGFQSCLSVK